MNPHKERDIYMSYVDMSTSELETLKAALETEYASHCAKAAVLRHEFVNALLQSHGFAASGLCSSW